MFVGWRLKEFKDCMQGKRKWKQKIHNASTGSKLAYVMRSTLDYFKLRMCVEITTNLAKLSKKKEWKEF